MKRWLRDAGHLGRVAKKKPYLRLDNKNKILRWATEHTLDRGILSRLCPNFWQVLYIYLYVCVQNIRNTFLILSCTPFCPQNSLNSSGHGLCKVSKAFQRDAGPCWLHWFPQLCQVAWMSFRWWTVLDTHRKLLSMKNPAALQFLTQTSAPRSYYHTPFKGT